MVDFNFTEDCQYGLEHFWKPALQFYLHRLLKLKDLKTCPCGACHLMTMLKIS
jgi:hypothetical protein